MTRTGSGPPRTRATPDGSPASTSGAALLPSDRSAAFVSLLSRARDGDEAATSDLFSVAYDQLKRLAHAQLRGRGHETLNTTALVHETFVKVAGSRHPLEARDRAHFMAIAAMAMRQILLDEARRRLAVKRGRGRRPISYDRIEAILLDNGFSEYHAEALLALDESLSRLAAHSDRLRQVVECRFFAGLSVRDTALALDISPATVKRDWTLAQAWLFRDLRDRE